jgi:hypothetical protein
MLARVDNNGGFVMSGSAPDGGLWPWSKNGGTGTADWKLRATISGVTFPTYPVDCLNALGTACTRILSVTGSPTNTTLDLSPAASSDFCKWVGLTSLGTVSYRVGATCGTGTLRTAELGLTVAQCPDTGDFFASIDALLLGASATGTWFIGTACPWAAIANSIGIGNLGSSTCDPGITLPCGGSISGTAGLALGYDGSITLELICP